MYNILSHNFKEEAFCGCWNILWKGAKKIVFVQFSLYSLGNIYNFMNMKIHSKDLSNHSIRIQSDKAY